ncbi:hypothetical protein ACQBAR_12135 [Propionibacteriaceae bacterium Y1685]|uniref:hypothetical protein n=1 Tax=Microlunatus sp. Y1700 TaxID=3418487 RepID=UPI003B7899E0
MAWKDWDRTNKVIVAICTIVAIGVLATFGVIAFRPKTGPTPTPPRSESSSSPSPTYQCTTASGPECTKDLAEKEAARDKAYADSEAALRSYYREYVRVQSDGGITGTSLPKELASTVHPDYQKTVAEGLKLVHDNNFIYTGSSSIAKLGSAKSTPDWPTDMITFDVCLDSTDLFTLDKKSREFIQRGTIAQGQAQLRIHDGDWKISHLNYKEVKSC